MAEKSHALNREWESLSRSADAAQARAIDDLLAHFENVETFLGEPLLTEARRLQAGLRSRRNELAPGDRPLEVVA